MIRTSIVTFLVAGLLSGCGEEGESSLALSFVGLVNGEPAECGRVYDGVGTSETSYTLQDFRLYVHDVRVVDASGEEIPLVLEQDGEWQIDDTALLDFETGGAGCPGGTENTNTTIRGTVSGVDSVQGVRFTVGVPFESNHDSAAAAPAPLNVTRMFWNWQGGYKFIRIDGTTTGLSDGFLLHLGSTGCDGDPLTGGTTTCANPNRMEVDLDNPELEQRISVDVGSIFETSNLDMNETGQPGCQSNPADTDCGPIFSRLGLAFGGASPEEQQLFSVGE